MVWLILVVGVVAVVVIALVAVGRVTFELADKPAAAVYDIEEAVHYIADRLPNDLSAKLSYDDVRQILYWRLMWLRNRGQAKWGRPSDDAIEVALSLDERVGDQEQMIDEIVEEALQTDHDIDEVDVVVVLDLDAAYLDEIGAIGPVADPD